jgi:hypothetical protein
MQTKPQIGDLLKSLDQLRSEKDEISYKLRGVQAQLDDVEADILSNLRDSGLARVSSDRLTVSITDKFRATYDPAKWPNIIRELVESGNEHLVQRRLTDAKVVELIESGGPIPDGLSVESYQQLSIRQNS